MKESDPKGPHYSLAGSRGYPRQNTRCAGAGN